MAQVDPSSQLIQLVNQLRTSYDQPPYQVDPILMSVAQTQASWSAANNYMGHLGPDGDNPDERARAAGYGAGYSSFAIENIAAGTLKLHTSELVVSMWQGDSGHLSAMISPDFEHIGIGYAEGYGMSWYVMMVGWIDDGLSSIANPAGTTHLDNGIISSSPFVTNPPEENGSIYHEVQSGQSAWTIAVDYEIDLAELLAANNLAEDSLLHPGDILLIRTLAAPTNTPEPTPTITGSTITPTSIKQNLDPTSEVPMSPETTSTLAPVIGGTTAPRSSLGSIFLVLGIGLIILVIVTILTNFGKL
jgi:LysM repeat protein